MILKAPLFMDHKLITNIKLLKFYRQLRGEELQGLNIEELQRLEKSLEAGLSRVMEKKVSMWFYMLS